MKKIKPEKDIAQIIKSEEPQVESIQEINKLEIKLPVPTDPTDEVEMSEEELTEIINTINGHLSKINEEFKKLIKIEEPIIEPIIGKIKIPKPKSIKIPRLTYKQIKAHCKEHNINIEEWIEQITLNEINRIVIRLGDIDYKKFKPKKNKKDKNKKEKTL